MKIFLSWSGDRSHQVAKLLSDWLSCVIQVSKPWISSRDIDRGALWFNEINDQLQDTSIGIVCLTQENKEKPWILFEAGALAKGLSSSRVCTFLIDLEPKDISDPLAQLNHTLPKRDSLFGLVKTLNSTMGSNSLDHRVLEQVFDTYWTQFEERFERLLSETTSVQLKPRAQGDVLAEILENTRSLTSRIRNLEYELEGVALKNKMYDASGRKVRDEIRMLVKEGMPEEVILRKLRGIAPSSMLRDIVLAAIDEERGRKV